MDYSIVIEQLVRVFKTNPWCKGFNVTDFDGTINTWPWLLRLLLALSDKHQDKHQHSANLRDAIHSYRTRGSVTFSQVMNEALQATPLIFAGLHEDDVKKTALELVDGHAGEVYSFPVALIRALDLRTEPLWRPMVAITGSPQMIAELFANRISGIHYVIGAKYYKDKKGFYTGERDENPAIRKNLVTEALLDSITHESDGSTAVVDSHSDLSLLPYVEIIYFMNPSAELTDDLRYLKGKKIIIIREGNKSGVHAYRMSMHGREQEISLVQAVPSDLVANFPKLRGLLDR